MREDILKRAMFSMPLSKVSRNSGILEGFEDMEPEEAPEEMPQMARTPQNPEILMNNLRGDMRSVDARYQELADLVGEEAAMETPPEVLAMLQPQLGQQASGIAALGQGPGPMPPGMPGPAAAAPGGAPGAALAPPAGAPGGTASGGIAELLAAAGGPPGGAPAGGAPAAMTPPQGMAKGGIVQHFKEGSDEEGVTQPVVYPPQLIQQAQNWAMNQANFVPTPVPTLQGAMAERLPMYNELLGMGRSKEDMQTQMLLDLASRGLGLAGNVDEQGRPMSGSFASRLGQATRTLPQTMMGLLGEQRKGEMAAKQLALQAAEKDILAAREANLKGIDEQRKLFSDILKESGKAQLQSIFGKGDWHWAVINRPGFLASWAAGKTTPEQNALIDSALTVLNTPKTETRADPVTGQPIAVTTPPMVPQFVKDAQAARAALLPPSAAPAKGSKPGAEGQPPAAAGTDTAAAAAQRRAPMAFSAGDPTLFNLAEKGTGPIAVSGAFVSRVPIIGGLFNTDEAVQATTFLSNSVNQLGRSVATSPRFAEGERKQIQKELSLVPSIIDRPEAYRQRLIGLDTLLIELRSKAFHDGYQNRNLGPDKIREGRAKVDEIDNMRKLLGVPPRISSQDEFNALDSGTPYILNGKLMIKK